MLGGKGADCKVNDGSARCGHRETTSFVRWEDTGVSQELWGSREHATPGGEGLTKEVVSLLDFEW